MSFSANFLDSPASLEWPLHQVWRSSQGGDASSFWLYVGPEALNWHLKQAKEHYVALTELLPEVEEKAMKTLARTPSKLILSTGALIPIDAYKVSCNLHLRSTSSMSVTPHPEP